MEFSWKKIEKEEKSCPAGFPKPGPVHRFIRFGTVQNVFSPVFRTSGLARLIGPVMGPVPGPTG
jgi:hypothetical protein